MEEKPYKSYHIIGGPTGPPVLLRVQILDNIDV